MPASSTKDSDKAEKGLHHVRNTRRGRKRCGCCSWPAGSTVSRSAILVDLKDAGYDVTVRAVADQEQMQAAFDQARPDLVVAPYLKRAIPESLWSARPCLVVHPGIRGDRGPSSLDWAIHDGEDRWGVTVLQANAEFDAGDIWAHREFAMRPASKSALYRHEVADAASEAVQDALVRYRVGHLYPRPLGLWLPRYSRSGSTGYETVGPDGGLVGPHRRDHAQPALLGQQPRSVRRHRRRGSTTSSVLTRTTS